MNTSFNTIAEVETLKLRAKTARKRRKWEVAREYLETAINLLLPVYQQAVDTDYKAKLKAQISDCYGMMGGIYRREGKLDDALKMYDEGFRYEDDDTYNLSNRISLRIIRDGHELTKMQSEIENAVQKISDQIQRTRAGQWWAWADKGLFNLLTGHYDAAIQSYANMRGADEDPYASHMEVLGELLISLQKAQLPQASEVKRAIDFLTEEKAKWTKTQPTSIF